MGMNSLRLRRFCILRNLINVDFISSYSSLCVLPTEEKRFLQVLNNHDLFVGSEATDYGDHLHNLHKWGT